MSNLESNKANSWYARAILGERRLERVRKLIDRFPFRHLDEFGHYFYSYEEIQKWLECLRKEVEVK